MRSKGAKSSVLRQTDRKLKFRGDFVDRDTSAETMGNLSTARYSNQRCNHRHGARDLGARCLLTAASWGREHL